MYKQTQIHYTLSGRVMTVPSTVTHTRQIVKSYFCCLIPEGPCRRVQGSTRLVRLEPTGESTYDQVCNNGIMKCVICLYHCLLFHPWLVPSSVVAGIADYLLPMFHAALFVALSSFFLFIYSRTPNLIPPLKNK